MTYIAHSLYSKCWFVLNSNSIDADHSTTLAHKPLILKSRFANSRLCDRSTLTNVSMICNRIIAKSSRPILCDCLLCPLYLSFGACFLYWVYGEIDQY